jgi:hypothetical protein
MLKYFPPLKDSFVKIFLWTIYLKIIDSWPVLWQGGFREVFCPEARVIISKVHHTIYAWAALIAACLLTRKHFVMDAWNYQGLNQTFSE